MMIAEIKNKKIIDAITEELIKSNAHISTDYKQALFLNLMLTTIDELITKLKKYEALKKNWKRNLLPKIQNKLKNEINTAKSRIKRLKSELEQIINAIPNDVNFYNIEMGYPNLVFYKENLKFRNDIDDRLIKQEEKLSTLELKLDFYQTTSNFYTLNHKAQLIEIENDEIEKTIKLIFTQLHENGMTPTSAARINSLLAVDDDKDDTYELR